jgi:hypothetical protein
VQRLRDSPGVRFTELRLVRRASVARSKKATFRGPSEIQSCPFRILSVAGSRGSPRRRRRRIFRGFWGSARARALEKSLCFPLPYRPPHIHVWGPIFGESEGVRSGVGFSAAGARTPPFPSSPPPPPGRGEGGRCPGVGRAAQGVRLSVQAPPSHLVQKGGVEVKKCKGLVTPSGCISRNSDLWDERASLVPKK